MSQSIAKSSYLGRTAVEHSTFHWVCPFPIRYSSMKVTKSLKTMGAEELAWQLRTLADLVKEPSLTPSTHRQPTTVTSVSWDPLLILASTRHACGMRARTHTQTHSHTHAHTHTQTHTRGDVWVCACMQVCMHKHIWGECLLSLEVFYTLTHSNFQPSTTVQGLQQ